MSKLSDSENYHLDNALEVFRTLAKWKREADLQSQTKSEDVEAARCHTDVIPPMKTNRFTTKWNEAQNWT